MTATIDVASDDGFAEDDGLRPRRRREPRPSFTEGRPSMFYAVKQLELAVRHHLEALLKPAGITALQYTALTVLQRRDGLTLTELARNSFVKVPSMADLLRPLHERNLISRRADPQHGRRQLISLTAAGRTLIDDYADRMADVEQRMLSPLTSAETDQLRSLLSRCRSALS